MRNPGAVPGRGFEMTGYAGVDPVTRVKYMVAYRRKADPDMFVVLSLVSKGVRAEDGRIGAYFLRAGSSRVSVRELTFRSTLSCNGCFDVRVEMIVWAGVLSD